MAVFLNLYNCNTHQLSELQNKKFFWWPQLVQKLSIFHDNKLC